MEVLTIIALLLLALVVMFKIAAKQADATIDREGYEHLIGGKKVNWIKEKQEEESPAPHS